MQQQAMVFACFKLAHPNSGSIKQRRRDRIVVSTLRCGRNNPGSNPGHGIAQSCSVILGLEART